MNQKVKIVECPRDAMQGIKGFIATEKKISYINILLQAGFDTIDVGCFVSPKAIPQMADTALVLSELSWLPDKTKLLTIVANTRGALEASMFGQVAYLGFPFSVSETFQQRNTNASIDRSLKTVDEIQNLCSKYGKQLVVYLSMAFGNPYGDAWNPEIVLKWAEKIIGMEIKTISLADTTGVAEGETIALLFKELIGEYPEIEFGAHFHTTPSAWKEKVKAAFENGCRRFDGAIKGFGGCPMASDELTGNMPTENLLSYFEEQNVATGISKEIFLKAACLADEVFTNAVTA